MRDAVLVAAMLACIVASALPASALLYWWIVEVRDAE